MLNFEFLRIISITIKIEFKNKVDYIKNTVLKDLAWNFITRVNKN